MIYATMCIRSDWISKYKDSINRFAKQNKLFVLTDDETYFENCETISYTRNIFSYYEKINLILNLLKKYKQRITYVDSDWLQYYDTKIKITDESLYTYEIFNLNYPPLSDLFKKTESKIIKELYSKIGLTTDDDWYVPEAIISFPYHKELSEIIKDFKILQEPLENIYNKTPIRETLERYSDAGIGYGEGWAITAIVQKYNIVVKDFTEFPNKTWRKIGLI